MAALRIARVMIRIALRTRVALFFTFIFPLIFLFVFDSIFAHGDPRAAAYLFGPVVVLQIMGSSFFGLGLQTVTERERGSLRRYRLAPIGSGTMVSSNVMANYLLLLPTVAILVICAMAVFKMPLTISILNLWILVTIGAFAFAGFGLAIASVANTMQEAQIYNNIVWFPLLFLSGATFPLPMLPHWVQRIATFLPATYLVDSFQGVMSQAQGLGAHAGEMVALVISGAFGLLFAWKLFRWEKDEKIRGSRKALALAFVLPFIAVGLWMNARANPGASWRATFETMTGSGGASQKAGRSAKAAGSAAAARSAQPKLVSNFDSGRPAAAFGSGWATSTDALMGGKSTAEMKVVSGGAEGSKGSLQITGNIASGTAFAWAGAMFSPGPTPFAPADLSAWNSISFWAKGDGRIYRVMVFSSNLGRTPAVVSFVGNSSWKRFTFPFSRFAGVDPHSIEAILFAATYPPGQFAFQIDSVAFQ